MCNWHTIESLKIVFTDFSHSLKLNAELFLINYLNTNKTIYKNEKIKFNSGINSCLSSM